MTYLFSLIDFELLSTGMDKYLWIAVNNCKTKAYTLSGVDKQALCYGLIHNISTPARLLLGL